VKKPSHANKLKALREDFKLSQRELGRLLGYKSDSHVSRIERGDGVPGFDEALKMAMLFDEPTTSTFIDLRIRAAAELIADVDAMVQKLSRTKHMTARVKRKVDRLVGVLASLRNHDNGAGDEKPWQVTTVELEDSES
jgi:transcriptional regulator with XRE-family HTH domain